MAGFEFDEDELLKAISPQLNKIVKQVQRSVDGLSVQYRGRPVDEIKPVLKGEFARFDMSADDAELTKYAHAISSGEPITVGIGK